MARSARCGWAGWSLVVCGGGWLLYGWLTSTEQQLQQREQPQAQQQMRQQQQQAPPLFSFGVIADVQWADIPDGTGFGGRDRRYFRGALAVLTAAVDYWGAVRPTFVAQLGDLVDGKSKQNGARGGSAAALEAARAQLRRLPCRVVSLVGNHDLYNHPRDVLAAQLATAPPPDGREYYAFEPAAGWRVLVLDAYQESVIGHDAADARHRRAARALAAHNPNDLSDGGAWFRGLEGDARRWVPYNGALGRAQLAFLQRELRAAKAAGARVLVLSHVVLSPHACDGTTMAWDYAAALALLAEAAPTVAMVLCGHDHHGGYAYDEAARVHHLTLRSPLNLGAAGRAYGRLRVHRDHLALLGPRLDDLLPSAERWPRRPPTQRDDDEDAIYFAIR